MIHSSDRYSDIVVSSKGNSPFNSFGLNSKEVEEWKLSKVTSNIQPQKFEEEVKLNFDTLQVSKDDEGDIIIDEDVIDYPLTPKKSISFDDDLHSVKAIEEILKQGFCSTENSPTKSIKDSLVDLSKSTTISWFEDFEKACFTKTLDAKKNTEKSKARQRVVKKRGSKEKDATKNKRKKAEKSEVPNSPVGPYLNLNNVVASVNLKCTLDLRSIALNVKNAEYNPKNFVAWIIKQSSPRTTALVYPNGKMIVAGAKNDEACRTAAKKFAKKIKLLGFEVKFDAYKVVNRVLNGHLGYKVKLESIAQTHLNYSMFEPEIFPGLLYTYYAKSSNNKISITLFSSGAMTMLGIKNLDEAYESFELFRRGLERFKLTN